jgi:hypothetical protein
MGSSMRLGKVAPGLWGPWAIVDFSGWSDQMTLGPDTLPVLAMTMLMHTYMVDTW